MYLSYTEWYKFNLSFNVCYSYFTKIYQEKLIPGNYLRSFDSHLITYNFVSYVTKHIWEILCELSTGFKCKIRVFC